MQLTSCARYLVFLLPCLALTSACERRGFSLSDDVPISRGATFATGGFSSVGGDGPTSSGGTIPGETCTLDSAQAASPIFAGQTVSHLLPARKEIYALVNDAEAEALRGGAPLVAPPEPGSPASTLSGLLQSLRTSSSEQRRKLGEILASRFSSFRSTWPNPWALRFVGHPGSERMNAVRIVLRDEALIVRLTVGAPHVVDVNNASVALEVALAEPERIAAVYYQLDNSQPISGVADRCENGMREIALGSEAMVQEWSLGTRAILTRLDDDIELLLSLFEVSRKCTGFDRGGTFRATTVCQTWQSFSSATEYLAYQWSLATPVEPYKPTPQNLASLIQALQEDRSGPDAFVVKPEPPPELGAGGSGGEGGEGGGAAGSDGDGQGGTR